MSDKVKPSEVLSKTIHQLLSGEQPTEQLLSDMLRLGAQHIVQQAAEAEVDEFLGRGWYERSSDPSEHRGYRNGYTPITYRTTQGRIKIERPRVRDNDDPFESQILRRIDSLEERLVKLATEMYVRGLSTRDIEQTLVDEDGKAVLSRSVTSRLAEELYAEYERWCKQDLSSYDVVYLFLDGVYESVRRYTNGQTILCAWGICSDGRKVLLGLQAVASESAECWGQFFQDLKDRSEERRVGKV